jgi:phosphomannomutase
MIPETNFEVKDAQATLDKLRLAFKDGEQDELDGLSVNYPSSWFNIRVSNTEPVIRLNAEAKTRAELDELVSKLSGLIQG